ncbi:indolepyruvate ferredoxin oxidoreductase subunit alpha [Pseudemcibacter aquimaris]|uniref:indolepyruvate ferredoxin oxidoreductase subunit alpha n=1 Tax=Pseudemcibacter aquimaris TaxID=2857064 RepID=UPI002011BC74|nr:indolepyruvate ferredoxin oxidoreductase subunit alpha [Pseudemcibacter aquimaris]MCC3861559.1 indolepyruvate ferredoxin oxidoreductase subunit alpha [Pseudemcibacter aquimaris]WDU58328.1 indolepyruvate ferredoxin oxidoreductase subunit alpha [Pseudemcibacter aquimaris]
MAERSFKKEVEKLRLGKGEDFRGEGILAVTKALLQSGVSYVGGYQGSPISHLMDVLADAEEIMNELNVHFETSASEATAAAMLAASVNYPLRGAVTWKSTVGTNVASDALANVSSGGVTGGALVIVGEDYGEGSSIMQERSHAFAMKSQMWLLDPRPNLTSIVDMVETGFELSEASNTPVMLELRIRACHVYGRFTAKDNVEPEFKLQDAMENPNRDTSRIVLPPANYLHEHEKLKNRWPAAVKFIKDNKLNELLGGDRKDIGIIVQGGLYNSLIRALELLGLSDEFGNTDIPIYVMNVTYPVIDDEILEFTSGKEAVLLVEEGHPEYIEHELSNILRKAKSSVLLHGKDMISDIGEYTTDVIKAGLEKFARQHGLIGEKSFDVKKFDMVDVPPRPAGFCTGCPERPMFTAIQLVQKEIGDLHISADIGCHLFSILPPFNIGNTTMGYGLGWAGASAFNKDANKRTLSIMGDGGFWHNGLTSGVGNAVFNQTDNVLMIVDNNYSAATGGQDLLSSKGEHEKRSTQHSIADAVKGVGVKWVKTVRTYDLVEMHSTLLDAMTTSFKGPKVIVAQGECMLNRQRREKPIFNNNVKSGERMVRDRFYVDSETCTGDHSCIRLSGCPSLTLKENPDPLKSDPVAYVDNSCVGCGHCGEVAHAEVLCPSFSKVSLIYNPSSWDKFKDKFRRNVIGWMQHGAEKKRMTRLKKAGLL